MPINPCFRLFDICNHHNASPNTVRAKVCHRLSLAILYLGLLSLTSVSVARERVTLCSENSLYPFVYLNGYKAAGILRDIAKVIAIELDLKIRVRPMDWNKCLEANKNGEVDGILGAGFTEERNTYMQYPGDGNSPDTSLAIWAPIYSVITATSQAYNYNGNPSSLPLPVRIPEGFFIAESLRRAGIDVTETETGNQANLINLAKDQQGSVVMLKLLAVALSKKSFFEGNLTISNTPYTQAYFYLPFSRQSQVSNEMRKRIWEAIKNKHNDKAFIQQIVDKNLERY